MNLPWTTVPRNALSPHCRKRGASPAGQVPGRTDSGQRLPPEGLFSCLVLHLHTTSHHRLVSPPHFPNPYGTRCAALRMNVRNNSTQPTLQASRMCREEAVNMIAHRNARTHSRRRSINRSCSHMRAQSNPLLYRSGSPHNMLNEDRDDQQTVPSHNRMRSRRHLTTRFIFLVRMLSDRPEHMQYVAHRIGYPPFARFPRCFHAPSSVLQRCSDHGQQ
jgi:hypothetical protein